MYRRVWWEEKYNILISAATSQFHYDTNVESIKDNLVKIGAMNAQSVKNKDSVLLEYMNETNLDLLVITETWLSDRDES